MKVLYLGPPNDNLSNAMLSTGDEVVCSEEKLDLHSPILSYSDFIVSYRYRHILEPGIVKKFYGRAINLHISFLPWNRGADPNLWGVVEGTPPGVTIHLIDTGVDTGAILLQLPVAYVGNDTLRTSYLRLSLAIEDLFIANWPLLRQGMVPPRPQVGDGTYHRSADRHRISHLLTNGWDTPIETLANSCHVSRGKVG